MKRFSILTLILITLILSACGAQAAPTANPVDIQSTMAAAAFTVVAETQAAIPTATPIPPTATVTDTPLPTSTVPPLPSSQVTLTAAPNSNAGSADPCVNQVMPTARPDQTVKMRINNSTRVKLAASVYLNQTTPQGTCGYRTYTIDPGQSVVMNDLVVGCYTLWAWNPDPEGYFIVTNGTTCVDTSNTWVFDISTRSIQLRT
ncbi:MAG TPA: hypothetical protein VK897_01520 [Anaerolineales bacterium]|nr:hypothetical protein [Anaerolineales bacterium]